MPDVSDRNETEIKLDNSYISNSSTLPDDERLNEDDAGFNEEAIEKITGDLVLSPEQLNDESIYTSKQVAMLLGFKSAQHVRNYLQAWEPILHVQKDNNGTALWTKRDIIQFSSYLKTKDEYNFTVKQLLEHYLSPEEDDEGTDKGELMPAGFDKKIMGTMIKRVNETANSVEEIKEEMKTLKEMYELLKEMPKMSDIQNANDNKEALKELETKNANITKEKDELKRSLETKDKEIEELKAQIENLSTKKRSFFGIKF